MTQQSYQDFLKEALSNEKKRLFKPYKRKRPPRPSPLNKGAYWAWCLKVGVLHKKSCLKCRKGVRHTTKPVTKGIPAFYYRWCKRCLDERERNLRDAKKSSN